MHYLEEQSKKNAQALKYLIQRIEADSQNHRPTQVDQSELLKFLKSLDEEKRTWEPQISECREFFVEC